MALLRVKLHAIDIAMTNGRGERGAVVSGGQHIVLRVTKDAIFMGMIKTLLASIERNEWICLAGGDDRPAHVWKLEVVITANI